MTIRPFFCFVLNFPDVSKVGGVGGRFLLFGGKVEEGGLVDCIKMVVRDIGGVRGFQCVMKKQK